MQMILAQTVSLSLELQRRSDSEPAQGAGITQTGSFAGRRCRVIPSLALHGVPLPPPHPHPSRVAALRLQPPGTPLHAGAAAGGSGGRSCFAPGGEEGWFGAGFHPALQAFLTAGSQCGRGPRWGPGIPHPFQRPGLKGRKGPNPNPFNPNPNHFPPNPTVTTAPHLHGRAPAPRPRERYRYPHPHTPSEQP